MSVRSDDEIRSCGDDYTMGKKSPPDLSMKSASTCVITSRAMHARSHAMVLVEILMIQTDMNFRPITGSKYLKAFSFAGIAIFFLWNLFAALHFVSLKRDLSDRHGLRHLHQKVYNKLNWWCLLSKHQHVHFHFLTCRSSSMRHRKQVYTEILPYFLWGCW